MALKMIHMSSLKVIVFRHSIVDFLQSITFIVYKGKKNSKKLHRGQFVNVVRKKLITKFRSFSHQSHFYSINSFKSILISFSTFFFLLTLVCNTFNESILIVVKLWNSSGKYVIVWIKWNKKNTKKNKTNEAI